MLIHLKDLPIKEFHALDLEDRIEDINHFQDMNQLEKLSIKSFEALTHVGENLKELLLDATDSQDGNLAILGKFSQLEKLTLAFADELTGADLVHLKGDHLQELVLLNCKKIDDKCLSHIAKTCPNLLKLSFVKCSSITGEGLVFLANMQIQELSLDNCKQLKGEHFIHLKNLPHLKVLNLNRYTFQREDLLVFKELPLEEIIISDRSFGDYLWQILTSLHTMHVKYKDSLFSFGSKKNECIMTIK